VAKSACLYNKPDPWDLNGGAASGMPRPSTRLGSCTTAECLDEIAREFGEQLVDHVLEKFAGLDPALLKAFDVDALTPICRVR